MSRERVSTREPRSRFVPYVGRGQHSAWRVRNITCPARPGTYPLHIEQNQRKANCYYLFLSRVLTLHLKHIPQERDHLLCPLDECVGKQSGFVRLPHDPSMKTPSEEE